MIRAWLLVLAGCAIEPAALPAHHPANAHAPIGRLAGAPIALRPGVVAYPDVPVTKAEPMPMHHHP